MARGYDPQGFQRHYGLCGNFSRKKNVFLGAGERVLKISLLQLREYFSITPSLSQEKYISLHQVSG